MRFFIFETMLPNNIQLRSGAQLVTCAESNPLAAADMRGNWLLKCSSHTRQLAHLHLLLIHCLRNQHRLQPLPEISLTFLLEVAQALERVLGFLFCAALYFSLVSDACCCPCWCWAWCTCWAPAALTLWALPMRPWQRTLSCSLCLSSTM